MTRPVITIPFGGFYHSIWSDEVDQCESMDAEHFAEDEATRPKELRISAAEYGEILYFVTDYSAAYLEVAREYVAAFDAVISEAIGMKLRLSFESMSSPREYNFTTDRLFAFVPNRVVRALFARSAKDKHATLAEVIRERFTSRDGFLSYYRNDLASWLAKPLQEWDHNELGTLLIAAMKLAKLDRDQWEMAIFEGMSEAGVFYNAQAEAVDLEKFAERVAELRAEKEAEQRERDPEYVAPPERCSETLDLFKGSQP